MAPAKYVDGLLLIIYHLSLLLLSDSVSVDDNGIPKSRLIVGASIGYNMPLGERLSDLLYPISKVKRDGREA